MRSSRLQVHVDAVWCARTSERKLWGLKVIAAGLARKSEFSRIQSQKLEDCADGDCESR